MRVIIPLMVLLFSMCGAQTQSTQTGVHTESQSTGAAADAAAVTTQLDASTELRKLRDTVEKFGTTVVELRTSLSFTQNELQNTKSLLSTVESVEAELRAVKTRLAATETDVENLKKAATGQNTEMSTMRTRLSARDTEVENLKMETAAQEAELTAVKSRLAATETDVVNLEKEITGQPKVAFSAGLGISGNIHAGNGHLNLRFTRILTNVGQAYSSTTGFFTAPVKGVYYFRFTVMSLLSSTNTQMSIYLLKNGAQVMYLSEYKPNGNGYNYIASGVTLPLEVGDIVNMQLPAFHMIYDNIYNQSVFSGFLLFPL